MRERRDSSVMVIALVFEIAALEPCPPPIAPSARVFSFGRARTMVTNSALAILVDVSTSFSRRLVAGSMGCFTEVNDRSRRCRFGQAANIGLTTASLRGA